MVIRGHWRSSHFNKRSNLENTLRNVILCMFAHMIHAYTLGYVSYTSKVIKGHWRSTIFNKRSTLENAHRNVFMLP